jgi:hypothetical protein
MLKIYESRIADVPEQHRAFYVADPQHGWRLDCDIDMVCAGLKSALRAERENGRIAKRKWRRLEALLNCTRGTRSGTLKGSVV